MLEVNFCIRRMEKGQRTRGILGMEDSREGTTGGTLFGRITAIHLVMSMVVIVALAAAEEIVVRARG